MYLQIIPENYVQLYTLKIVHYVINAKVGYCNRVVAGSLFHRRG